MKTFINKSTEITMALPPKVEGGEPETSVMLFADLAKMSLNTAPQGGWTTDEMRTRINITDKLEDLKVDVKVKLEDAEFEKILECSKIKWNFMHKDIVAYEDHLLELKTAKK